MPRNRWQISHRKKVHPRIKPLLPKKKPLVSVRQKILGICFVVLGLLFYAFPSAFTFWVEHPQVAKGVKVDFGPIHIDQKLLEKPAHPKEVPIRIIIPAVRMDLPVVEANVTSGYWELSETSASHGVGSANPGEAGNMVIFGHAREGLFLPLRDVKKDVVMYVLTATMWHTYRVSEIKEVAPYDTQVIAPTPDETLTLFTCSGFLDSKRLIVVAKPM